ncbi:MAG: bifunctional phosphopantothenoylcysteine decarboxylase/phosphopantothenate--cysteine ligase CoaBC [Pseudomonadales bacterium]|nr:bifunctional phosphopantothenoylcysteine decarboxylase/phosphopantothenate--cysteine ligase CoaBC [Pseudomonadales bacterium]
MTKSNALADKQIILGVSAGIAAYKAPLLVRALTALGADVQVVLSANAHHFVTPTSLQAVSGHPVRQNLWDESAEAAMGHIELARWADIVIVAPVTANTLAHLAHGFAHDLLTTLCLATEAPIFLAPAMNQQMYQHPATSANLETVRSYGYQLIGPESGEQACGEFGPGRMTEPNDIAGALAFSVANIDQSTSQTKIRPDLRDDRLSGLTVTITAGPTVEAIDPVRYISNHSSGLQGICLAESALRAGASVNLIAGPRVAQTHPDINRIDVISAEDMFNAAMASIQETDLFIGVAAVADYRPAVSATEKMKRSGEPGAGVSLELVENKDIIAHVAEHPDRPLVVGFAAETNDTLAHARAKRIRKKLDAIVLNDVSDPTIGFNSTHNAATLIYDHGEVTLPKQSKQQLADNLITNLAEIFGKKLADTKRQSVTN